MSRLSWLLIHLFFVIKNVVRHFSTFCAAVCKEVYSIKYIMQNFMSSFHSKRETEVEVLETHPDYDKYDPADEECWAPYDRHAGCDRYEDYDPEWEALNASWDRHYKEEEANIKKWCEENPGKDPFMPEYPFN